MKTRFPTCLLILLSFNIHLVAQGTKAEVETKIETEIAKLTNKVEDALGLYDSGQLNESYEKSLIYLNEIDEVIKQAKKKRIRIGLEGLKSRLYLVLAKIDLAKKRKEGAKTSLTRAIKLNEDLPNDFDADHAELQPLLAEISKQIRKWKWSAGFHAGLNFAFVNALNEVGLFNKDEEYNAINSLVLGATLHKALTYPKDEINPELELISGFYVSWESFRYKGRYNQVLTPGSSFDNQNIEFIDEFTFVNIPIYFRWNFWQNPVLLRNILYKRDSWVFLTGGFEYNLLSSSEIQNIELSYDRAPTPTAFRNSFPLERNGADRVRNKHHISVVLGFGGSYELSSYVRGVFDVRYAYTLTNVVHKPNRDNSRLAATPYNYQDNVLNLSNLMFSFGLQFRVFDK